MSKARARGRNPALRCLRRRRNLWRRGALTPNHQLGSEGAHGPAEDRCDRRLLCRCDAAGGACRLISAPHSTLNACMRYAPMRSPRNPEALRKWATEFLNSSTGATHTCASATARAQNRDTPPTIATTAVLNPTLSMGRRLISNLVVLGQLTTTILADLKRSPQQPASSARPSELAGSPAPAHAQRPQHRRRTQRAPQELPATLSHHAHHRTEQRGRSTSTRKASVLDPSTDRHLNLGSLAAIAIMHAVPLDSAKKAF